MRYTDIHKVREDVNPRGRVAVIGAMHDGPVGVPFVLRHGNEPLELLGDCPAARQASSIMEAGVPQERIILFRVNGRPHEIRLSDKRSGREVFVFRTIGCAEADKDTEIRLQTGGLVLLEGGVVRRTYVFSDFMSTRELATRINRDADTGLCSVEVVVLKEGLITEMDLGVGSYGFYETEPETNMVFDENQERSEYILSYIKMLDRHSGIEESGRLLDVPAEAFVFADIQSGEAKMCDPLMMKREETFATSAFYGTESLPGKTSFEDNGVDEDGNLLDENGAPVATEPWAARDQALQALLDADKPSHAAFAVYGHAEHLGKGITLEGALAARYVLGRTEEELTNKQIGGFDALLFDLRKEELAQLTGSGYICIVPSVRRVAVPYKGQFFRTYESTDIHRSPRLWRLGHTIGRWIGETLSDQLGEPTSLSLEDKRASVEKGLEDMKKQGVLDDYVLEVTRPTFETILCRADIRLPGTIEFITVERSIEYSQQEVFRWME